MAFEVRRDGSLRLSLRAGPCAANMSDCQHEDTGVILLDKVALGVWHDFVMWVKWTSQPTGAVTVWHRSPDDVYKELFRKHDIPTLKRHPYLGTRGVYKKLGLYVPDDEASTLSIIHDWFVQADRLSDVW